MALPPLPLRKKKFQCLWRRWPIGVSRNRGVQILLKRPLYAKTDLLTESRSALEIIVEDDPSPGSRAVLPSRWRCWIDFTILEYLESSEFRYVVASLNQFTDSFAASAHDHDDPFMVMRRVVEACLLPRHIFRMCHFEPRVALGSSPTPKRKFALFRSVSPRLGLCICQDHAVPDQHCTDWSPVCFLWGHITVYGLRFTPYSVFLWQT